MRFSLPMKTISACDFDLKSTIESGQIFRFFKVKGGYAVSHAGNLFFIRQEEDSLAYTGCAGAFLKEFLSLNPPIEEVKQALSKDTPISKAVKASPGLRILSQDPRECILSFICSAASNIPKIQRSLNFISSTMGKAQSLEVEEGMVEMSAFPGPGSIKDIELVKRSGCGFRARYLIEAEKRLSQRWIESLRSKEYKDAKEELMTIPGVGAKIADCALLFSLGHSCAFPVDVWIERAMREAYPQAKGLSIKGIEEFGRERFGKHAGYAQQYLYHWKRNLEKGSKD